MREHKFKSIITCIAVLTFAFVILSSIRADATSATTGLTRENNGLSTTDVTKMTSYEYTEVFTELTKDIFYKKGTATDIFYNVFDSEFVFSYLDYINNNTLYKGDITYRSVEYISASNSNTGKDKVVVNVMTSFYYNYNLCYCFEYSINSNGKIDGVKMWQY